MQPLLRLQAIALVGALAAALYSCKREESAAPTAPPPETAAPADTVTAAPTGDPTTTPATARALATTTAPQTKADAGDAGSKDAAAEAATTDAGGKDAGATSDGGAAKVAQCLAQCQSVLQTCMAPSSANDGGLPKLGDPTKCKAALDACQAGCK